MTLILSFLRTAWPYLLTAFLGFNLAWVIQQTRLDEVINDFNGYKTAVLTNIANEHERTNKITEEINDDWYKNINALHDYYKSRPVRVLSPCPPVRTNALPSAPVVPDGGSTNVAVGTGGDEAEVTVEECAVTTLQLLELRAWTQALRHLNNGK